MFSSTYLAMLNLVFIIKLVLTASGLLTVWKFHDFSVIQILREINFGESRSSKTAIFVISGALNFVTLVNLSLQKVHSTYKI